MGIGGPANGALLLRLACLVGARNLVGPILIDIDAVRVTPFESTLLGNRSEFLRQISGQGLHIRTSLIHNFR